MLDQYVLSNAPPSPFGSGPGSFQSIIQFELNEKLDIWPSWVHNDYLEIFLTFGIPGAVILFIIFSLQLIYIFMNSIYSKNNLLSCFSLISLLGVSIHAAVDFPLQVYSICSIIIILIVLTSSNKILGGCK